VPILAVHLIIIEESNGNDITKEPMIQKAIEMFEAKKVTVQSRI